MDMPPTLTPRQQAWFETVRDNLVRETGRSLEDWAKLVRTDCPHTSHRARLQWLKAEHGLGVNRGSTVLAFAFPDEGRGWSDPDALLAALLVRPEQRAAYEAVRDVVSDWEGVVVGPRKTLVGFSRRFQFSAIVPERGGGVWLGLAIPVSGGLGPVKAKEVWSERLKSVVVLANASDVTKTVRAHLKAAYDNS